MYAIQRPLPLVLSLSLVVGLSSAYTAEGTRLIGTGPVQVGTAGAGVASPQNSSWLSLNPAGLVDISNRVDTSVDIINGRVAVTPNGAAGNPSGEKLDDSVIVLAPAVARAALSERRHQHIATAFREIRAHVAIDTA